jgi:hypothetical protein
MAGFPHPEPGLVISYAYLWSDEAESGAVEGRKDRPCAVVLALEHPGDAPRTQVAVVPITHTPPGDPNVAVEIPPGVKRHLGFDGERSWVILDESNVFFWPGYDLRPISRGDSRIDYGLLPPKFFDQLIAKVDELERDGAVEHVSRDEQTP